MALTSMTGSTAVEPLAAFVLNHLGNPAAARPIVMLLAATSCGAGV
jgi:hypothetical protein